MPRRYYSSTAVRTTLSGAINSSVTSITVASVSGFPGSFPYTLIIDQDQVTEEIVTVTAASGTTLTVTRGVDGTSAVAHDAGAAVNHGVSARDFDEPNAHVNDTTTDVHPQYVRNSLVTAKADLVTATGSGAPARLGVGSNDTLLVADSATSTGLKWATLTASQIPTLTSDKVPTLTRSVQTGSYTLALADAGDLVEMGSGSAQTLTIPTNSSVAFPIGTKIDVLQTGAGECSIAPVDGTVTLNSEGGKRKINAQWQAVSLVKRDTNTWVLIGAIKT